MSQGAKKLYIPGHYDSSHFACFQEERPQFFLDVVYLNFVYSI
jgi:hypothetical protein